MKTEPLDLAAIEARASVSGWPLNIQGVYDARALLAEVKDLRAALRLAMSALTRHLDAYAELSGLPDEYTDDSEVVYETISAKVRAADGAA